MKLSGTFTALLIIAEWSDPEDEAFRYTKRGRVIGKMLRVLNVPVETYWGIPFAEAPIGNLRFKPPVARSPWQGIYRATSERTACPQYMYGRSKEDLTYTEDCLRLNIWAPILELSTKLPVLVWIHGGGFSHGSSASRLTDGTFLAAQSKHVVVAMNYRLGILGFLNAQVPEAPGNMGLLDQHLALKWVQENIESFGGDPRIVTLIGVSAGSMSVHAHVLSPMSKGLFTRAVMMSGTAHTIDFVDSAHESLRKGNDVAKMVGCSQDGEDLVSHPNQVLECLRQMTADELVVAASKIAFPMLFSFLPTYHDRFLPKPPAAAVERHFFSDIDVLAGVTSDEGAIALIHPVLSEFLTVGSPNGDKEYIKQSVHGSVARWMTRGVIRDMLLYYESRASSTDTGSLRAAYIDYMSDREFNCPLEVFAEKHSARGNAVYVYIFGQKAQLLNLFEWMGAPHGMDVPYLFSSPSALGIEFTDEDKALSKHMIGLIASFSKNG